MFAGPNGSGKSTIKSVIKLTTAARSCIQPSDGITKRMAAAGKLLLEHLGAEGVRELTAHPSDTVRGWAAYSLAAIPDRSLEQRLSSIRWRSRAAR